MNVLISYSADCRAENSLYLPITSVDNIAMIGFIHIDDDMKSIREL